MKFPKNKSWKSAKSVTICDEMACQVPVDPSRYYECFLSEREEILKHKWIESGKAQEDIGFERALTEWITRYREGWQQTKQGAG